jgi:hypothetical protein
MASRYAFDGRPDVGVDRVAGPYQDDGSTPPPNDLASLAASAVVSSVEEYRKAAALANLQKDGRTFIAFILIRPSTTA